MVWFASRFRKTGTDDKAMGDDNNAIDGANDDFTMDEKSFAAWNQGCKFLLSLA